MRVTPINQCLCCLGLMVPLLIIVGIVTTNIVIFRTGGNIAVGVFNIILIGVVLVVVLVLLAGLMLKRGPLGKLSS